MSEFTKDELDEAVKLAVENAKQQFGNDTDAKIAKAVSDALAKANDDATAAQKLALDKERSKREDIEARLKASNKKQMPQAFADLDDETVQAALTVASEFKDLSPTAIQQVIQNIKSGNMQNVIIAERERIGNETITPLNNKIAELESELSDLKGTVVRAKKHNPLRDALLKHVNPDPMSQKSGFDLLEAMFEDDFDEDGNLVAKQVGEHNGIDPETNTKFTPETAAKYLAKTVWYLKKPSTTSNANGGPKPKGDEGPKLSLAEELKGKTPEQKQAIIAKRKAGGG